MPGIVEAIGAAVILVVIYFVATALEKIWYWLKPPKFREPQYDEYTPDYTGLYDDEDSKPKD